jgi:para-aminobenzoate synthetase
MDFDAKVSCPRRHDSQPNSGQADVEDMLFELPSGIGRRPIWKKLLEAGLQATKMRLQLNQTAVDDEQRLEDALAGIGSPRTGHGGHCGNLDARHPASRSLKTLLIDNYDSFTYNLFQLLGEVSGEEPLVVRNDEASWEELAALDLDNVVISPGPGRPDRKGDFGVCAGALRHADVPLLGVCLGHQGLGSLYGAAIVTSPEPVHGRLSAILHDDSPLFAGIPREFQAVRYHSLCVEQPLPDELRGIAWTSDGVLMAVEHRECPLWGVQFHPESICTEHGRLLLQNFRKLSEESNLRTTSASWRGGRRGHPRPDNRRSNETDDLSIRPSGGIPVAPSRQLTASTPLPQLIVKRLEMPIEPEAAFVELYGGSANAFWLDSSRPGDGARFSFMGDDSGPLGAAVSYDIESSGVRIKRDGEVECRRESIFDYLAGELDRFSGLARSDPFGSAALGSAEELPFGFDCGFAGYLGYELKAECGGKGAHRSPLPDAAFVFADRLIAFDHAEKRTYLLCLVEPGVEREADEWLAATSQTLRSLPAGAPFLPYGKETRPGGASDGDEGKPTEGEEAPPLRLARPHERYLKEIVECKRLLAEGETYEVCLTNAVLADALPTAGLPTAEPSPDPLALYRRLRRVNPAPFSSYLRFGDVAVLSSSPERFLRVGRDRWVESKPIKGTSRRGATPAQDVRFAERLRGDEKNRAENLMIADLMRNDLGSVCEIGTVHVPSLMQVESYETVHQLVTTVRGLLREELGPLDCVRACFPPGSMTGAPKLRTMRILDELEGEARGVYSGAIGWFGLGGGCDLSVAIRTIVTDGDSARVGAGGAIVLQSDPEEEYAEMLLKAGAPLRAIDPRIDLARHLGARCPSLTAGLGSSPRSPA